jgi:hypothetical protein
MYTFRSLINEYFDALIRDIVKTHPDKEVSDYNFPIMFKFYKNIQISSRCKVSYTDKNFDKINAVFIIPTELDEYYDTKPWLLDMTRKLNLHGEVKIEKEPDRTTFTCKNIPREDFLNITDELIVDMSSTN